jgi:CDP-diacylglycerol--serine O-phosphatidyltransferase
LPDDNNDRVKIFVLPTFLTAGNLFCGYMAVITIATGRFGSLPVWDSYAHYRKGILWILLAFVFDFLDGLIARVVKRESQFGKELDSLADLLSFGMAPALLVSSIVLEEFPLLGPVVAFAYLAFGAMRLARFNIQPGTPTKEFIGFPIPAAAGVTMSLTLFIVWLNEQERDLGNWKWAILLIMVVLSFMMISQLHYPSFKNLSWTLARPWRTVVIAVVVVAILVILIRKYYPLLLALFFVSYLLYGLVRPWVRRNIRREIEFDEDDESDQTPDKPAPS